MLIDGLSKHHWRLRAAAAAPSDPHSLPARVPSVSVWAPHSLLLIENASAATPYLRSGFGAPRRFQSRLATSHSCDAKIGSAQPRRAQTSQNRTLRAFGGTSTGRALR